MNRVILSVGLAIAWMVPAAHGQIAVILDSNNTDNPDTTALATAGADVFIVDGDTIGILDSTIQTDLDGATTEVLIGARQLGAAWVGSLNIGRDLVIRGFADSLGAETQIDGGANPAVDILGSVEVELDSLILRSNSGPAVRLDESVLFLVDCDLSSSSNHGLFVLGDSSSAVIDRCIIDDNGQDGIRIRDDAFLLCYNTMFRDNGADGVQFRDGSTGVLGWCTFLNNSSDGVVNVGGGAVSIQRSCVYLNGATGLRDTGSGSITGVENYIYDNGGASPPEDLSQPGNLTGVTADGLTIALTTNAGSLGSRQPVITLTGANYGKIIDGGPLDDQATGTLPFGFELDFEGDPRPEQSGPGIQSDIGADEENSGGGAFTWTECEIQSADQLRPNFIGIAAANTVTITITTSEELADGEVFIVPQGGDPDLLADRIPLTKLLQSGDESRWTNTNPIDTVLDERAAPAGEPNQNDLIADGHGAVYIEYLSGIYGYPAAYGTENDQVLGQAILGRHVIIDTVPPRLDVCRYGSPVRAVGNTGEPIQAAQSNDAETAAGPLGLPSHNYPSLPTTINGIPWEPATEFVPADDGGIGYSQFATGGQGASAFFNVGSFANLIYDNITPSNNDLWLVVQIGLIDDVVRDSLTGAPITGIVYSELLLPDLVRQPGGFGTTTGGPYEGEFSYVINDVPFGIPEEWDFAKWRLTSGSDTLANATKVFFYPALTSIDPDGCAGSFSGYNVEDQSFGPILNRISAVWDFSTTGGMAPGSISHIDEVFDDNYMHLGIEFVGRDLAGNRSTYQDDDSLLIEDTLHVWWIVDTAAELKPDRSGTRVDLKDVNFTTDLDRGFDTNAVAQPQPVYTYRIWQSNSGGDSAAARVDTFVPVTPWAAWDPSTRIDTLDIASFAAANRWTIVATSVIDEAGNVAPFPTSELPLLAGDVIDTGTGLKGTGWQKFFLTSEETLNTSISGTFWWDDRAVGDVPASPQLAQIRIIADNEVVVGQDTRIIPSPPSLQQHLGARFTISYDFPTTFVNPWVQWELVKNGNEGNKLTGRAQAFQGSSFDLFLPADAWKGDANSNLQLNDLIIDNPAALSLVFPLEDISLPSSARKSSNYVLRARVWNDADSSTTLDTGELVDPTPASYAFTVIPESSVSAYIDPKNLPEDQPIRVNRQQ